MEIEITAEDEPSRHGRVQHVRVEHVHINDEARAVIGGMVDQSRARDGQG